MNKRINMKLRSRSGETIAETLVALLISALALVMLAGAISSAARVVTQSETAMQTYYQSNNALAEPTGSSATINIQYSDKVIRLADETSGISVKYAKNDFFSDKPVVAYAK